MEEWIIVFNVRFNAEGAIRQLFIRCLCLAGHPAVRSPVQYNPGVLFCQTAAEICLLRNQLPPLSHICYLACDICEAGVGVLLVARSVRSFGVLAMPLVACRRNRRACMHVRH